MPAGLGQHTLARVDQDHGDVGGGGAGDHVAGVLLVAGSVGDDELALLGGEETIGHVDGDALFALGGQAVHQQGEVQFATLGAVLLRVALQGAELVFQQRLGFIEQAADQRAFAVVDTAAGDETQQGLVLVCFEVLLDVLVDELAVGVHQKYPSTFFFSMDPALS